MPESVSAYIIACNEAGRIGTAIRSVIDWADEVIVVDSGSTDETVAIAESLGARVYYREWEGYGPQKRFAEESCSHDWVLNLDADEEVTPELAHEIQRVMNHPAESQAAWNIPITDLLPGESSPAWHAYSYVVPRLYCRSRAQMSTHPYQDRIEIKSGKVSTLTGRLLHRSFVSWTDVINKINFYSTQVGTERAAAGRRPSHFRVMVEFPAKFLKVWIGRRYILRGSMGFQMSITIAFMNMIRLSKAIEAADRKPESVESANHSARAA